MKKRTFNLQGLLGSVELEECLARIAWLIQESEVGHTTKQKLLNRIVEEREYYILQKNEIKNIPFSLFIFDLNIEENISGYIAEIKRIGLIKIKKDKIRLS